MKLFFRRIDDSPNQFVEVFNARNGYSLGTLYKDVWMDGWAADGALERCFSENIADGSNLREYKRTLVRLARGIQ